MKRNIIIWVLVLVCRSMMAQVTYTLDECKQLACENNYVMQNSRLDLDMAIETRNEAFTHYFPIVSAAGTMFWTTDNMIQFSIPVPVQLESFPKELSVGLIDHGKAAGIMALQPVFFGGRIVNANKLARIGEQVSEKKVLLAARDTELKTEEYFWKIISLKEKLITIETAERQVAEIKKTVATMVEVGVASRNDLLRVELQEQDLAANRLQVENGIRVVKLLLKHHAGIRDDEYEVVADTLPIASPLDYYVIPQEAVQNRVESAMLDKGIEAARMQYSLALGENLPTISVGGGYMYYDITGRDVGNGIVMVNATIPISSWWGGSHRMKKEKLNIKKAENERQNNREMMIVQIEVKWNELEEAYKQILLAEKSVESSAENLRLNNNYYRAGTASLAELLDAQTLARQSRDKYSDAVMSYRMKLSEYLSYTGR